MFSEIINPFLNVRNKIKDASGNWVDATKPREDQFAVYKHSIDVDSSLEEVIFETWDKKVIIDALFFGSDTTAYPLLWIREGANDTSTNEIFRGVNRTGGGGAPWPSSISNNGNHLLEIEREDESGATVSLKRPLTLPNGGKLLFTGSSNSDGRMSYKVVWREIKE